MSSNASQQHELPEGWFWPDADEMHSLHAELQRELPAGHILYDVPVTTFATRRGFRARIG